MSRSKFLHTLHQYTSNSVIGTKRILKVLESRCYYAFMLILIIKHSETTSHQTLTTRIELTETADKKAALCFDRKLINCQ